MNSDGTDTQAKNNREYVFIFGVRDLLWVSQGQYFIFGALCPSKSGLMNKHIVKHIVKLPNREQTYRERACLTNIS